MTDYLPARAARPARTDPSAAFADIWPVVDRIPGWLTRDQGAVLWHAARALPPGSHIVEIGSHRGRSTVVLGHAARAAGARVTAIDPFVAGRLFGGEATREVFAANITAAGLDPVVRLLTDYSTRLRPDWAEPIDMLYIDGKHDYWTVTDDLLWSRHLPPGGEVFVHDCFSSIGVTSGLVAKVLFSADHRYLGRAGSLARFVRAAPLAGDRARMVRQLPWFSRNVLVKTLLRLQMRPAARLLGHDGRDDPF